MQMERIRMKSIRMKNGFTNEVKNGFQIKNIRNEKYTDETYINEKYTNEKVYEQKVYK